MSKYLYFFIILSLLLVKSKCNENEINSSNKEDIDDNVGDDFYGYFKQTLKDYLVKNNLFNSDKEIEPKEMKKIFFEVVTEGGPESSPKQLRKAFDKLANYFVQKYYNEKKQIKGKDIYNLIDIDEIYNIFIEINGENPLYNEEEEEKFDNDNIKNDL